MKPSISILGTVTFIAAITAEAASSNWWPFGRDMSSSANRQRSSGAIPKPPCNAPKQCPNCPQQNCKPQQQQRRRKSSTRKRSSRSSSTSSEENCALVGRDVNVDIRKETNINVEVESNPVYNINQMAAAQQEPRTDTLCISIDITAGPVVIPCTETMTEPTTIMTTETITTTEFLTDNRGSLIPTVITSIVTTTMEPTALPTESELPTQTTEQPTQMTETSMPETVVVTVTETSVPVQPTGTESPATSIASPITPEIPMTSEFATATSSIATEPTICPYNLTNFEYENVTAIFSLANDELQQMEQQAIVDFCDLQGPGQFCYQPLACRSANSTCSATVMVSCPDGVLMSCSKWSLCHQPADLMMPAQCLALQDTLSEEEMSMDPIPALAPNGKPAMVFFSTSTTTTTTIFTTTRTFSPTTIIPPMTTTAAIGDEIDANTTAITTTTDITTGLMTPPISTTVEEMTSIMESTTTMTSILLPTYCGGPYPPQMADLIYTLERLAPTMPTVSETPTSMPTMTSNGMEEDITMGTSLQTRMPLLETTRRLTPTGMETTTHTGLASTCRVY